jgi:aminomethyltransferase
MADLTEAGLKRTPLHGLHQRLGAKMVPFAGWEMPVQYGLGVMKEHLHTRAAAGLFDVSHMGQVILRPRSGKVEDAAAALERLVPVDLLGLKEGRQRYAMFTSEAGGILDDLMVAHRGDHLFLVVNASRADADIAHMKAHLSDVCEVLPVAGRALLALQGPAAEAVLDSVAHGCKTMHFMDVGVFHAGDAELWVSRSGYTGEDGFEISVPSDKAVGLAGVLLARPEVEPVGLGARDSLRLEAGLCLHGSDIDEGTTPIEADLAWAIQKARREGGARTGGFPGAPRILRELAEGPARRRVGLLPEGRAPMRGGTPLFAAEDAAEPVGQVTSGGFGPSVDRPVSMGYVPAELAGPVTPLWGEVRGKRLPATVAELPFRPSRYKR